MSLDELQITEALSRYAEGVTMTSSDLDRMQEEFHQRTQRPTDRRWRLIAAVAAAVVLIAAVAGGAWWLRKPADPVPVSPQPAGSLTGLWKFQNTDDTRFQTMFVIRPDDTASEITGAKALVRNLIGGPFHLSSDGRYVMQDGTNAQGQPCHGQEPILEQSDGFVRQGPQVYTGPGCDTATGPAATLTRLSPVSPATRDLPAVTEGVAMPVTDLVQLNGVWLLQHTGVVLAVDETSGPAEYVMDANGDIDSAPDSRGPVEIQPESVVVLTSPGCDTTLSNAVIRYSGTEQTLTATVATDPCNRFRGQSALTWIRVLAP